jgi:hypothetical protein
MAIRYGHCSISYLAYACYQVEEMLFRVHSYFFVRDSPYFQDLLVIQSKDGAVATEDMLIRLDNDVKSVDFERFLSILYPPCVVILSTQMSLTWCSASLANML